MHFLLHTVLATFSLIQMDLQTSISVSEPQLNELQKMFINLWCKRLIKKNTKKER